MAKRIQSIWKFDDFQTGTILLNKGDREIVYLAKKKSENKPIITTIREINKKKTHELKMDIAQIKNTVTFLNKIKHRNLIQVWGMFWDDKKVCFIQEPAIRVASLMHVGGDCILNQSSSLLFFPPRSVPQEEKFLKEFKWQIDEPSLESQEALKLLSPKNVVMNEDRDGLHQKIMMKDV